MKLNFHKYQGTGNDFIIIDNRASIFKHDTKIIEKLCDRKFGIGADGLMLLQNKKNYDFEMVYFNADGNESSMCGNGGRCIVAFAAKLGIVKKKYKFIAMDGEHEATISKNIISLKMLDVKGIEQGSDFYYLNTGSPHFISFKNNIDKINLIEEARKIRYNKRFSKEGTNVNFAEIKEKELLVRTYERGVEDETLSCGTGVTAVALCAAHKNIFDKKNQYKIKTKGGNLTVKFNKVKENSFNNIWLEGAATFVFTGEIEI